MKKNSHRSITNHLPTLVLLLALIGCGASEIKPIDIFPEDTCANCRMAISDKAFASQLITEHRDVFKFDDLECLLSYKKKNAGLKIAATFVKDFESKEWLHYEKSAIVKTSAKTPMGSGLVAFKDSMKAREFAKNYPPPDAKVEKPSCCADEEE